MKRIGIRPYLFFTAALSIAVGLGLLGLFVQRTASRQVALYGHHRARVVVLDVAKTLRDLYRTRGLNGMKQGAQHFSDLLNSRLVVTTQYGVYTFDPTRLGHRHHPQAGARHIATVPLKASGLGPKAHLAVFGPPAVGPELFPILRAIERSLLWASIAGFLTALALSVVVGEWVVRPVRRVTEGVRRLGEGELSHRVAVEGPAEVSQLGDDFNHMAEALDRSEQNRRQMVADVAHELRTPLSVLMGYLEAMRDGIVPEGTDSLEVVRAQGRHLTRLVADLQDLAMADAGELQTAWEPLDLRELARRMLPVWEVEARGANIHLAVEDDGAALLVRADAQRLRQALENYLANALKYTPRGGRVTVRTARAGSWGRVTVEDTGPGIAADELPNVFARFYRVDPARSSRTGGSGLGLAIAKNLVERQGGRVGAASEPGRGSRFWLEIPLAAPPQASLEPKSRW